MIDCVRLPTLEGLAAVDERREGDHLGDRVHVLGRRAGSLRPERRADLLTAEGAGAQPIPLCLICSTV